MNNFWLLLTFFFIFWPTELLAQSNAANLEAQIAQSAGRKKIDLQIALAKELLSSDAKTAIKYAETAEKASEELRYWLGFYESSMVIAKHELQNQRFRKASKAGEDAVTAAKLLRDKIKQLAAYGILLKAYGGDKRKKKLEETQLTYENLANTIALTQTEGELSDLQGDFENTVRTLGETTQELEILEQEKLILENRTLALENDSIKNALEISEQERQLMIFGAKTKRQARLLRQSAIGLLAMLLILVLSVNYFRLRKAAAEERASMQQQLMHKDKMATLGQMTAGIAHEIKNPLNFVNNFAEGSTFLLEDLGISLGENRPKLSEEVFADMEELIQEAQQNAVDILSNGKRVDQIINSMMDHARGDTGQTEDTDINKLVQNNLLLAYHGFKAHDAQFTAEISENLDASLPSIRVIPQDVGRALLNIFNNAFEAAAEAKEKNPSNYTPELKLETYKKGNAICINIRDNAGGITESQQAQIFNPFFTTKPTGQGNTGLGLSISYDIIVTGHNGSLTVESDGQTFSEFLVQLPIG